MKKLIIKITLVGILSLVGLGVVMAQDDAPEAPTYPNCPNCPFAETGSFGNQVMHEYMNAAWAKTLGITQEEYANYQQQGMNHFEIAEELNIEFDTIIDLMAEVRLEAIEMAFEDGAISEDQYQFFMDHIESGNGFGRGMGFGGGYSKHHGGGFGGGHWGGQGGGRFGNGLHDCPNYMPETTE